MSTAGCCPTHTDHAASESETSPVRWSYHAAIPVGDPVLPRYYRVRAATDRGRAVVGSLGALLGQRRYKLRHVEDGFELSDRDPDRAVAAMEEHFQIWHEGSRN